MLDSRRSEGRVLQLSLLAIAVVLLTGGMILSRTAPKQERKQALGQEEVLRRVTTLSVERQPVRPQASFSGILEARRTVKLHAETRGPVLAVGAEELDRVESGQDLVRIDPVLAEAEVERARAALTRSESELALAKSNLTRRQQLAERNVLADSALEDTENLERVAQASLREARAVLRRAREDLQNKVIRAPFAGALSSFSVERGEYVREGQVLAELLDLETARMKIGVTDREVVAIRAGQPVRVEVAAFSTDSFSGTVLRVGSSADSETRRFPVEIEIPNPETRLLPGMVAQVSVDLGDPRPLMVIPREVTVDEFGLRFVYVVEPSADDSGWVARRRRIAVRPIPFRPGDLEVVEGLAEHEEIAVSGVRQLRDGERVRRENGREGA